MHFLTKQCTRKAICNSKRGNRMCIGAFDIKINDYNEIWNEKGTLNFFSKPENCRLVYSNCTLDLLKTCIFYFLIK